jgi:hypothetical protein
VSKSLLLIEVKKEEDLQKTFFDASNGILNFSHATLYYVVFPATGHQRQPQQEM